MDLNTVGHSSDCHPLRQRPTTTTIPDSPRGAQGATLFEEMLIDGTGKVTTECCGSTTFPPLPI
jgi:hypothetical protein